MMGSAGGPQPEAGVLVIRGLQTALTRPGGAPLPLVDGIDLTVRAGERWAIVGESGSGKSITARTIMGLVDPPLGWTAERMEIGGIDLARASRAEWRAIRGHRIAMVQQDPLTALSPVFTVGNQLVETIRRKHVASGPARARAADLLRAVGIPDPERRLDAYPHEMSGGMRQRVAIALALACAPQVLIADEPTTALDVTVQAQILKLMAALSDELGTAVVMVTHDIGILPGFAHHVAVMYGGRLMEVGPVAEVLAAPEHPYTRALLAARPGRAPTAARRRLPVIAGTPPDLLASRAGCPFAPRCVVVLPVCTEIRPAMVAAGSRRVACHAVRADAGALT
jgi:oligopeptide/dipeptide ABC transporter ATP-binding protein